MLSIFKRKYSPSVRYCGSTISDLPTRPLSYSKMYIIITFVSYATYSRLCAGSHLEIIGAAAVESVPAEEIR